MKHIITILLLFSASFLQGANVNTIKSGDYHDPCIWSNNSVPGTGDDITINHNINFSNQVYFFINNVTISNGVEMCGYYNFIVDNACNIYVYGTLKANSIVLYSNLYVYGNITTSQFTIPQGSGNMQIFGQMSVSSYTCNPIPSYTILPSASICGGDSALIFGVYQNIPGTYWDTVPGMNGCDSVISQELVTNSNTSVASVSACDSYTWNGHTFTFSGTYDSTFVNAAGCDSVATLNLTINTTTTGSSILTACDSYIWNGDTIIQSGIYTRIFANNAGCDSTHTLTLTILQSTTSSYSDTACDSYTWAINGFTYTSSVIDTVTGVNAAGCIETNILNLTINNSTTSITTDTVCGSYTWAINGSTYTSSVIDTVTGVNAAGCIETNILNLTINYSNSSLTAVTACDSYTWNGNTFTFSGTYDSTFVNTAGCDSIATLNLTINTSSSSSDTIIACDSYTWNGITYTSSGAYDSTFTNGAGCDSIVTLHLTIVTLYVSLSQSNNDINVNISGGAAPYIYLWNTGANSEYITPTTNGDYWVIVEDTNGCLSDTVFYTVTWIPSFVSDLEIEHLNIYPNPSRGIFNISFTTEEKQNLKVRILNVIGEEVYKEDLQQFIGDYTKQIDLTDKAKGIYFLEIETDDRVINKKLLLQ